MNKDFRELKIWRKSRYLILAIYKITERLPDESCYNLISEMRKNCIAITANIAKGFSSPEQKELMNFLLLSMTAACKLESLLREAYDLNCINYSLYKPLAQETMDIKCWLGSLVEKVRAGRKKITTIDFNKFTESACQLPLLKAHNL
ncbi:MAG: four helix bundle protein [bacterium]